jgi:aminoglycoside phosphotransferase (APT) family kinase protein
LHQIPLDSHPVILQIREEFTDFVKEQQSKCVKRHRRWYILLEHLIQQIQSYLSRHDCPKPVCLIHADVSWDHVFGYADSKEHWHTTGLIDFGDARVGDPVYELVGLHCNLFELDTNLLRPFLQADQLAIDRVVHRAMVSMLLFQFNIFKTVLEYRPEAFSSVTTLEKLAENIWSVAEIQ